MNYLLPLYNNQLGSIYALKSSLDESLVSNKLQLQLAEMAIILSAEELIDLLNIAIASQKSSLCTECSEESPLKLIKLETEHARILLKFNKEKIVALEELINGALFKLEMEFILDMNDIS